MRAHWWRVEHRVSLLLSVCLINCHREREFETCLEKNRAMVEVEGKVLWVDSVLVKLHRTERIHLILRARKVSCHISAHTINIDSKKKKKIVLALGKALTQKGCHPLHETLCPAVLNAVSTTPWSWKSAECWSADVVSSLIWLLLSCIDTCTNPLDTEPEECNLAEPDELSTFIKVRTVTLKDVRWKIREHRTAAHTGIWEHVTILDSWWTSLWFCY